MAFEQAIQGRGDAFGIPAQVAQVIAHKRKLRLVRVHLLDKADALDGLVLKNIAAQPIDGIGGIDNYAAAVQAIDDSLDISRLRIIRVHMQ